MGEAILPFIRYILLQFFVATTGLIVVKVKELGFSGLLKCWIFGQMLLFAVLQIMAVPMILLRWKFNVLFWSCCGVYLVLFCFGCWRFKKGVRIKLKKPEISPLALLFLMTAALLILYQAGIYFFGMHLDEDDARWLAEANDALETGDMFTRSVSSGEYLQREFTWIKDVVSPWPMMYAIWSRLLNIRVSLFSHTLYSPIALIMMYSVYWLIGDEVFKKHIQKIVFIVAVGLINMSCGFSAYTQSTFSLVRIWQGKATVAAIMIPLVFYIFLCIHNQDKTSDWILLFISAIAACLTSGMGIVLSALMIIVYGAYDVLAYKRWRKIPLLFLSIIPSLGFYMLSSCL